MAEPAQNGEGGRRSVPLAIARGARGRCPACGRGPLFSRYIRTTPACAACGEDFTPYVTADFAAYLAVFLTGVIFVPAAFAASRAPAFAPWMIAVLVAAAVLTALALLPRMKGAVIGVLWALDVRG